MDRNDLELTRQQCVSQMLNNELTIVTLQGAIRQIDELLKDEQKYPKKEESKDGD